jgi:hypothetical protein
MFNKLKNLFTAPVDAAPETIPSPRDARLAAVIDELGEPNHVLIASFVYFISIRSQFQAPLI